MATNLFHEIEQAICELDWYAKRRQNLASQVDRGPERETYKVWAESMEEDIATLRKLIAELKAQPGQALEALKAAQRLHKEALPKFNWGASALDGNAITLLNEVPGQVSAAIKVLEAK